jgi:hypothetical protein
MVFAHTALLHRAAMSTGQLILTSWQVYPFVVVFNDEKWNLEKRFSDFAAVRSECS